MARKKLPKGEKKKALTIFVREKHIQYAKKEVSEIERKYNSEGGHKIFEKQKLVNSKNNSDNNERVARSSGA